MFPTPIISQYGNNIPKPLGIKDIQSKAEYYIAILGNDGKLYVAGTQTSTLFGTAGSVNTWYLIRSDVDEMYCGPHQILIKTATNGYLYIGRNPFSTVVTTATPSTTWVDVTNLFATPQANSIIKSVQVDSKNVALLMNDGTIWIAGYNGTGMFGTGNLTSSATFIQTSATSATKMLLSSDGNTGGNPPNAVLAWSTSTNLYAAGYSQNGSISNTGTVSTFTNQGGCVDFSMYSFNGFLAKQSTGLYNYKGTLSGYSAGNGTSSQQSSTANTAVGATVQGTRISTYATTGLAYLLGNDGLLYSSGNNSQGEAGQGSTSNIVRFTAVSGWSTSGIRKIVVNQFSTFILTTSNEIYHTGRNAYGTLPGLAAASTTFQRISLPTT